MPTTAPTVDPETLLSHESRLRSLVRGLLFDDHEVDDVVQEAVLATMDRTPRQPGKLGAFMGGVARNLALKRRRTAARTAKRERGAARPEAVPSAAEIAEREETRRMVVAALMELEQPYRDALVLRYFEDLTPKQIAKRLDAPASTIRTRLQRGLDALRQRLDRAFGSRKAWMAALGALLGAGGASAAPAGLWAAALAAGAAAAIGLGVLAFGGDDLAGPEPTAPPLTVAAADPAPASSTAPPPLAPLAPDEGVPPVAPAPADVAVPPAVPLPEPTPPVSRPPRPVPPAELAATAIWGVAYGPDQRPVAGVRLLVGVDAQLPEDANRTQRLASSVVTTDASGRWTLDLAELMNQQGPKGKWALPGKPGEMFYHPPAAFWFVIDVTAHRGRLVELAAKHNLIQIGEGPIEVWLDVRPGVRFQLLDAVGRYTVKDATAGWGHLRYGADGSVVYHGKPGARETRISAPGYADVLADLTVPDSGVTVREQPVLMQRGFAIRGRARSAAGAALNVTIVVEQLDVDGTPSLVGAYADATGQFEVTPCAPGRWRVMAFAGRHAVWSEVVTIQDRDADVSPVLEQRSGHTPPTRALPWRERRALRLPLKCENQSALEVVEWVQEILGVRMVHDAATVKRLAARSVSCSFTHSPVSAALSFMCDVSGLTLDADTGRLQIAEDD